MSANPYEVELFAGGRLVDETISAVGLEVAEVEPAIEPHEDFLGLLSAALDAGRRSPASAESARPGVADGPLAPRSRRFQILPAREFVELDRPSPRPLIGEPGDALLPEGADLILRGDGGASKSAIATDLACHMAAGDDWLGDAFPIRRALTVAMIEAEGPEGPYAEKLARKLAAWEASPIDDRLLVYRVDPWPGFDVEDLDVATDLGRLEVDVLIAGPMTVLGMEGNGTPEQAREFMAKVARFREATGRPLSTILIGHDNTAGRMAGAFKPACDTLIHAEVTTPGKTSLWFEKARWSTTWHMQRRRLGWTSGEGFELIGAEDRALLDRVVEFLRPNPHSTTEAIAAKVEARPADVRGLLNEHLGTRFRMVTGSAAKDLGARSANTKLWEVVDDA